MVKEKGSQEEKEKICGKCRKWKSENDKRDKELGRCKYDNWYVAKNQKECMYHPDRFEPKGEKDEH